jgi:hypothetical protein
MIIKNEVQIKYNILLDDTTIKEYLVQLCPEIRGSNLKISKYMWKRVVHNTAFDGYFE